MCTKNYVQIMYGSWDMVQDRCNYFSFWAIFCPFTPLTARKIKILKKWNKHLEISSFCICVPKIMTRWCTVPEICCAMEGWTDGWKKWHTEVGAPPKNHNQIYKKKSTPASLKMIFPQEQTIHFHINSNSVIRPVKWKQLRFSSIEINKPFPAPVHSIS